MRAEQKHFKLRYKKPDGDVSSKVEFMLGAFPTDDSLKKMLYLATLDLKGAFRGKSGWPMMLGQLQILFEDRIPKNAIQIGLEPFFQNG